MSDPVQPIAGSSSLAGTSYHSLTTLSSRDIPHTHLAPDVPPAYLQRHVVQTLLKRGFEGAEAGALLEIERLLEHHITSLYSSSRTYADLAGREGINAFDVLAARDEVEYASVKRFKKEAKRRRKGIKLETTLPPPEPKQHTKMEDLPESAFAPAPAPALSARTALVDEDKKPDLASIAKPDLTPEQELGKRVQRLDYAWDGAPALPPKWTYAIGDPTSTKGDTEVASSSSPAQPTVSAKSLAFVKLTASGRGDIPPELGIVNYRLQRQRARGAV